MREAKKNHTLESLCCNEANDFQFYFKEVSKYKFEEKPNYDYLETSLLNLILKEQNKIMK